MKFSGYSIPIQAVLVNDYYNVDGNHAQDGHKPSNIFDDNPSTFIHSRWGGSPKGAGATIYFGGIFIISKIIFIPRFDYYLGQTKDTIFTIIKENGETEDFWTLTETNPSPTVAAQTYDIPCDYKEGVGLKVWKPNGDRWCVAEVQISYLNRK